MSSNTPELREGEAKVAVGTAPQLTPSRVQRERKLAGALSPVGHRGLHPRERERERERERDRQTETETETERQRQRDRQTESDRQTDRQTERERELK